MKWAFLNDMIRWCCIEFGLEKENINTLNSSGEFAITLLSSLAQQESESLSKNVKLGLQYRYQQGKVQVNHTRFLGYTKDENGNLIIDPEQAEIVKRIFREYLEGASMDKIAKGLERNGILTGAGNTKWHTSGINRILRNEKYMGDALLQKTVTTDFLTKKRIVNNGSVPQYYVEDDHEGIISKETFMLVQEELVRRRLFQKSENKRNYSSNHPFSQRIFCGECGEIYRRIHWNNRGKKSIVWRCLSRLQTSKQACKNRTISEQDLENIVVEAINLLLNQRENFLEILQSNIKKVLSNSNDLEVVEIDTQIRDLQNQLLQTAKNGQGYDKIGNEILRLQGLKEQTKSTALQRDEDVKKINEICEFLGQQDTELTEFDETLVKRYLEKITVFGNFCRVELKSSLTVDVNI